MHVGLDKIGYFRPLSRYISETMPDRERQLLWKVSRNSYALYQTVRFLKSSRDPNYPQTTPFSICCVAFLYLYRVEIETSNLVGRFTVTNSSPQITIERYYVISQGWNFGATIISLKWVKLGISNLVCRLSDIEAWRSLLRFKPLWLSYKSHNAPSNIFLKTEDLRDDEKRSDGDRDVHEEDGFAGTDALWVLLHASASKTT